MADESRHLPQRARLKARLVALDTLRENVVVLSRGNRVIRPEHVQGSRRIELSFGASVQLALPMISDEAGWLADDEIGLPQPLWRRLGAAEGDWIDVEPSRPPESLAYLRRKMAAESFTPEGLQAICRDLADHRWSDMDVSAFLVSCASFMTAEETLDLTRAMIGVGERLTWPGRPIVDKHCIGGVPGNRTSLIVAPIAAAHGLTMPKTSSRAITSPAGTADTMEVLARVDLSEDEMRDVVERCGACIVWGGRVNLSPADDVLISVERPLGIDTVEQMVASILSKKVAAGSTHLVLDLPVGPSAKLRSRADALRLRKLFEFVGSRLGLVLDVVLTDAPQPIGRGVGPALEARDVLAVLEGRADAPRDLREKAIMLAGRVLEMDPDLRGGQGEARARDLLESGAAARRMDDIRSAQGPSPVPSEPGDRIHEVCAAASGRVAGVDCLRIATIARSAGAPTDPGAGVDLLKRVGDEVRVGEPIYRIHAVDAFGLSFAADAAGTDDGYRITG